MSSTTPYVSEPTATSQQQRLSATQAGLRLGERLRQLRVAGGMTQSALAGDRFSKEYVSQIERGKTRPTPETIDWLPARPRVAAGFLANGVSADARGRVETTLARAEALTEADQLDEAAKLYLDVRTAVLATGLPELEARALSGHGRVLLYQAKPREALDMLVRARELS